MKYIETFERYKINKEYISKDKIIEYSKSKRFLNINYTYFEINKFFEELPNRLKLERILYILPNEDIDTDKLGIHYTFPNDRYPQFLWKIGLLDEDMEINEIINILKNLKVITILVNKNDIDFDKTAYHNINYNEENEITIKEDAKITIVGIDKYEWGQDDLEYPYEY